MVASSVFQEMQGNSQANSQNLKKLNEEQLRAFFTDAVKLAYDSHVEKLEFYRRERTNDFTVQEMLDKVLLTNHNVCINRNIQHDMIDYGEVGYRTSDGEVDYFLYCYLNLDNLKILTDKYDLVME